MTPSAESESLEVRRKARIQTWICPGAGFATVGHRLLALSEYVVALVAFLCVIIFAIQPSRPKFQLGLVGLVAATLFWLAEYFFVAKIQIAPSRSHGWSLGLTILYYLCAAAMLVLMFKGVGSFKLRGSGMSPTILPGERILYSKHAEEADLVRGHLIAFRTTTESAWGKGGDVVIARILAAPGDRLAIENDHYVVNGRRSAEVAPTGRFAPGLDVGELPKETTVPPDCFFIVQDAASQSFDSRVLSWARRENVIATKLFLMSRRGFGKLLD